MTVCRFFQQGNCKFGNNCRNEHPNPNNNRNQTSNRFGALGGGSNSVADKYSITVEAIERDLTNETPQWILSAYAPGRDAPGQLFGGYPREQSFEELRLHYVMGKASGNEQQALNQAQELWTNAQQQMQNAVRNAQEAVQFIVSAENNHPNRQDICKEGTQGAPFGEFIVGKRPKSMLDVFTGQPHNQNSLATSNTSSPFGGGASAGQSAFGQPSALGAKPSPFGAPSFGQPSQPNTQGSAFGQPSQLGQGGSAFGQPSQLGQGGSAFGQPSQPTTAFGQPSQPASAFGQASQPASAFGQTSALGAKPSPFGAPSFGQPSQPNAQGSAFGQASQLGQKPNPFGSATNTNNNASPFGSAGNNNNAPAANPFGAPSGGFANNQNSSPFGNANNQQANSGFSSFGKPSQGASPFGQQQNAPAASSGFASANQAPAQNANNPFGQPSQPQPNGFASQNNQQANPFGQPSQPNPFGQPSAAPASANPFASAQPQAPKPAAVASSGNPYPPNSSKQHPPVESYSSKGMDGRLLMFRGKPVTYKDNLPGIRDFDGTWRRIWFPDGPPGYSKDTELPPEQYDDKSKAQWMAFAQKGEFEDGVMPELPPPRECTLWNF